MVRKVLTPKQFVAAYQKHGSMKAIWRSSQMSWHQVRQGYLDAVEAGLIDKIPVGNKSREQKKDKKPVVDGRVKRIKTRKVKSPSRGVKRSIYTSAQNNTRIHEAFWRNLLALREKLDATLHVGTFTYKKDAYGKKSVKRGKGPTPEDAADLWYDERLEPYICDERVEVAPGLIWCGEMNILPTAKKPLSDLDSYTGRKSGIFPHVKMAMESVASGKREPTKFNYTTGAVTVRNYIQKKAGLKAEFHHAYGALLVEVNSNGDWFVRQLWADSDGTFYDMDLKVRAGKVTSGHRAEVILWGDIHVEMIDPAVRRLAWGRGGMLDTLRPKEQHMGDVVDFRRRSHWDIKDPHIMFRRHVEGQEDVGGEMRDADVFLRAACRPWCKTVIIESNHHKHIGRWLKDEDGRKDPVNAEFWLGLNARVYGSIRHRPGAPVNFLKEAMRLVSDRSYVNLRFLDQDESHIICPDANGGIECGMHGDKGPGGKGGTPEGYAKMGRKANVAHTHKAGIYLGVATAGTCSTTEPDWMEGPNAHSHSHVVTYQNGKRAIYTMFNGGWRA